MGLSERTRERLRDTRLPVVYYDSGLFEAERCLYRDERATGRAAVALLAERGHRRIGFFHTEKHWLGHHQGTLDHHSYGHRMEGYAQAMAELGERARHLVADSPERLAEQIRAEDVTGVVVMGGLPAPLMQALGLAGLAMPRDVSVVSCDVEGRVRSVDGFELGGVINDRFSSGERAAEMILRLIEEPNGLLPSVIVPPETRTGQSVAPARA
jgi:DNA-binding LacI/PurR family transcriptional regulator